MTTTPIVGSSFFGLDISQVTTWLLSIRRRISKRVLLLEFGPASLLMAEATLTEAGVQLSHVSSFSLPPEALDRGVPADPLKMARLIQDFCTEKKIPAHRVAVVLPPELAFQRLLELPKTLTTDEAREYVLNPANGLQIPFPLIQTDFDLFPVSTLTDQVQAGDKRLYMLTAIPEVLVDPIVVMLQAADLELQLLELGSHSQLRNHSAELVTLGPQQVDLVLELLPEYSSLMLVSCSGLLGSERLASIRNLPALDLEEEQLSVALGSGLSLEDLLFKDENYLPISDLDLRVLVADLKASLKRFSLKLPEVQIRNLILTGVNSSHPLLVDLLEEMTGLPIVLSRARSVTGLAALSMDDLLLQSALGRLTGLALGLLPNDQLLACSLDIRGVADQQSQYPNDLVAIADLLGSSDAQTGLDLVTVETSSSVFVTDTQIEVDSVASVDTKIESVTPLDTSLLPTDDLPTVSAEPLDGSLMLSTDCDQVSDLATPLSTGPNVEEKPLESVSQEMSIAPPSEHDWPSIAPFSAELQSDSEVIDADSSSEGRWPSINCATSRGDDDSVVEAEWPSIDSTKQDNQVSEDVLDAKNELSEWPSIALDDALDLRDLGQVIETPVDSVVGDDQQVQEADAGQMYASTSLDQSLKHKNPSSAKINPVDPSESLMADFEEKLVIPDLRPSLVEQVENQNQSNNQLLMSDQAELLEESKELGELRFAED